MIWRRTCCIPNTTGTVVRQVSAGTDGRPPGPPGQMLIEGSCMRKRAVISRYSSSNQT